MQSPETGSKRGERWTERLELRQQQQTVNITSPVTYYKHICYLFSRQ